MAQSVKEHKLLIEKFDGSSEEWEYYYERLKVVLRNNGVIKKDKQRDTLLGSLGPQPFKVVLDHARPTPVSNLTFSDIVEVLDKYYGKQTAPLSERVRFSRRYRHEGESVNQFEISLRELAANCEFGDNLEERLRDQVILGINNDTWQRELLRLHSENSTKLKDVLSSALLMESIHSQQSLLSTPGNINKVDVKGKSNQHKFQTKNSKSSRHLNPVRLIKTVHCLRCGRKLHEQGKRCPALGVECSACGGDNHFARACIKAGNAVISDKSRVRNVRGSRHSSSGTSSAGSICSSDLDAIRAVNKRGSKVMLAVELNGHAVSMLYDPGAASSIISKRLWEEIGSPALRDVPDLTAYTGIPVKTLGATKIKVKAFGKKRRLRVTVVEKDDIPLFGLDWVLEFELALPPGAQICTVKGNNDSVKKLTKDLITEFHTVFEESLGTIKNCQVVFHMTNDARPIVAKARNVPFALRKSVEGELARLVENGIITEVDPAVEPITWASPIVIVVKPTGAVRICADFKHTINKYIIPENYPLPTFEEIASRLAGGREFTVIDLKDAYLQMEVDPSVQKYLVIATHKGYYRYTRMPFGIKIATSKFQHKMDQLLAGLDGVASLLDDVIITGNTREQHIERVRAVLQILSNAGIRAQKAKCKWFQESVTYLGHRLDKHGIHPTQKHIEALRNMPSPQNTKELRSFLGTVNYYSKFVPHLQTLCAPLHDLLRKGTQWKWTKKEEDIATKLKHYLSTGDTLAHFDSKLPVILTSDASDVGVGAAIFHKYPDGSEKPIAFASRRLDSAERKYSVVDKEALALIFGVTRFNQYLYGRKFEIRTDHKPLVRLFGEHDQIPKIVSNRLSRWALTLSSYDYTIVHQKGKDNITADLLSRFPLDDKSKSQEERLGNNKNGNLFHLRVQDINLTVQELRNATAKDKLLSKVIPYIEHGWPSEKTTLPEELHQYSCRREELSFEHGVVLWLGRIVIPNKLRQPIMTLLHEGHPGIAAIKSKAKFQVWWPNMDKHLEEFVQQCSGCQENRPKDTEVPVFSWTVPTEVWSRLHIDYAGPFQGKMWLIIVDAKSKWLEVIPTNNTSSANTILMLREVFTRFGLPRVIVSDNGPQFASFEFESFCKNLNIKHARITPYHPRTNGLAERCVRTFKERMEASKHDGGSLNERLQSFLLADRTSTKRSTGKTPSQMMFGRNIRTKIDLLRPDVNSKMEMEQLKQRENKKHGPEKDFSEGEEVWVQNNLGKGYKKGRIRKKNGPYSYEVDVDGLKKKKHADQLRKRHCNASASEEGEKM